MSVLELKELDKEKKKKRQEERISFITATLNQFNQQ